MAKETYIKITMTDEEENIQFQCGGGYVELKYLACEIFNQLLKMSVEKGFSDEDVKADMIEELKQSLDTFE